jgi:neuropeptide Y receptor
MSQVLFRNFKQKLIIRVLGKFLCHLVSYSLGISVYVSTLTSLAIAIDRYFVIIYPFKPRMKLCVCIMLIGVVWIVSLSISLPLAIYMKLVESKVDGVVKYQCRVSKLLYTLN